MPRPHRAGALSVDGRCLSVCLSVLCLTLSRERKGTSSWHWQKGSPWKRWPVTPFRGRKVKGQGNKITSKNIFSFAARPTTVCSCETEASFGFTVFSGIDFQIDTVDWLVDSSVKQQFVNLELPIDLSLVLVDYNTSETIPFFSRSILFARRGVFWNNAW